MPTCQINGFQKNRLLRNLLLLVLVSFTDFVCCAVSSSAVDIVHPNLCDGAFSDSTTFTVVFTHEMNTSIPTSVSFGLEPPNYNYHVDPNPGWITTNTWQGTFDIVLPIVTDKYTIRVWGAEDLSGNKIAEDTSFLFRTDTGGPGANNGITLSQGTRIQVIVIENNLPENVASYNLHRSVANSKGGLDPPTFINIKYPTILSYDDFAVGLFYVYYYRIELNYNDGSSGIWGGPIRGTINGENPCNFISAPPIELPTKTNIPWVLFQ